MKKFLKVLFINIGLLIVLFFLFEFFVYQIMSIKENNDRVYPRNFISAYTYLPIMDFKAWYNEQRKKYFPYRYNFRKSRVLYHNILFRESVLKNSEKPPILFLGCSFTYGGQLQNEETLSSRISEVTNRSTFNMGLPGWGIQQSLYMIKNKLIERLDIQPEYVIYTFIPDHMFRMIMPCSFFENSFIFYKNVDGKLVLKKDYELLYWHSYITRFLTHQKLSDTFELKIEEYSDLFLLHLLEINKEIKLHSPNSTFVIFVYEKDPVLVGFESKLKENGIEVIYLNELAPINIYAKQNVVDAAGHPSAKVWLEVAPLLAKKLNL